MIKANELMIGNWIELKNSDFIKVELDNIEDVLNNPSIFQPIPLTSEIMEKCGFESERYGYTHKKGIWVCSLTFEMDFLAGPSEEEHNIKITSLHQLQNLYFALTGEELTINFKELTFYQ